MSPHAVGQEPTVPDGYRIVWADEFEKEGKPDRKKWTYETGFVRNNELQWYQADNAYCKDGRLMIEGRRETRPNPDFEQGNRSWRKSRKSISYTSACLLTRGLHQWQYGRFEIRAKIVAAEGLWPAIWFLGVDGRWPSCGEIDLMEFYDGQILANACWSGGRNWRADWDTVKKPLAEFKDDAWDERFHIWRMDWDEASIRLYVDNLLLNTIHLTETINASDRGPKNPFHQPHYLLLNLAIGGTQGGDPSDTPFPTRYEIDYVRVYQQELTQP